MGGDGEIQGEGQGDLTQPSNATRPRGVLNCSGIPVTHTPRSRHPAGPPTLISSLDQLNKGTMATLTQVTLTCDVCGKAKDVQTRTMGLDGKTYEIDLCPKDGKALSKAAAEYVSNARTTATRTAPRENGHRARSRADTAAVRDWARASGMTISDRGRVPAAIFRDYQAAH